MGTLSGRLLLAVPRAHDADEADIFARSVILVLHHGEDGAHGLVLTVPLDAPVESVLPGWQRSASAPGRLFHGGPVGQDVAIALANAPGQVSIEGVERLFGSLSVVDLDADPIAIGAGIAGLRVFVGSCGWDSGQLDAELGDGWWVRADWEIGDLFDADPATLWRRVMVRQGFPSALMASFPQDPDLN